MRSAGKEFLRFGPFRLDADERQLLREDGTAVPLTAKAFDVLLLLVRNRDRTVTKEEFMAEVWAGTVVEEANLTDNISTLRQALGDDAREPLYIRTVPRRGYRFVAAVTSDPVRGEPATATESPSGPIAAAPVAPSPLPVTAPAPRVRRRFAAIGLAVVVLATLAAITLRMRGGGEESLRALAVLPFKPLVAAERDEAMEIGMTDALIAKLSRVREISVRPTTAVLPYTEANVDFRDIGSKLDVDAILDGKVLKRGDRMRVSVQLVRAADGSILWADRFDEPLTDMFALQDAISERVANALQVRLTSADRQSLSARTTDDVEAYQLYLQGRHHWRTFTPDGLMASVTYFNAAIARDPNFAQAWAGLANAYSVIGIWGPIPAREAFPRSRAAAQRAVALAPHLGETHIPMIVSRMMYERDWKGAKRELDLVQQLDPSNSDLHTMLGYYQQAMGRADLALVELRKTAAISPDWHVARYDVLEGLVEARRFDEAITECRAALALDSRQNTIYAILGAALAAKGRYDEAVPPIERAIGGVRESRPRHQATLAWTLARAGRRDEALAIIEEMKRSKHPWMPFSVARAYTALGDKDQVFFWLNRAADEHFAFLWDVRNRHEFDVVRDDPRYMQLLARMKL
jgi:TolB-like protein/DNA-binding winged helix-turn-helix (wHTH) protein/tetratricopeptide (TPR) repeat protein